MPREIKLTIGKSPLPPPRRGMFPLGAKIKVSLWLPEKLDKRVEVQAAKRGLGKGELVAELLARGLRG